MNFSLAPNKKNILITGANGFIGSYLSSRLDKNYNVFSVVFGNPKAERGNLINLDLTDTARASKYFQGLSKKYKFYGIIHLAANFVSPNATGRMNVLYDNLKITESMARIAVLLKPRKIINFSSMAVYPNSDGKYTEDSRIQPSGNTDCFYGLSKFCAENIFDFLLKGRKTVITHLRVSQVYGKLMRQDRIIPVMLKELKERNTISLYGKGRRVSNFIAVDKLFDAVKFFLSRDLPGIYNVGQENLSFYKLAMRLIRKYGDNKSKIITIGRAKEAKFYLDTSRLEKIHKGFRRELLCV
jgi:nucleoside-diphosphate-sugar epimerase